MSKAKLERLLNLTALLLETPRPLTAEEIHSRVSGYPAGDGAFRQAFERDKADLREMGIPLANERPTAVDDVPGTTAYRIHKDDYYLADPGLDAAELAALHLASRAVRLDVSGVQEGLNKLEGAVDPGAGEHRDGADKAENGAALSGPPGADVQLAALPAPDDLGDVFEAVTTCRPVQFSYHGEVRTVDPHKIEFQRGRWYLSGFDHLRRDRRVYRLDRVDGGIEVLAGPTFTRPAGEDAVTLAEPWQMGEGEPVAARLLVDPAQAPWVVSYLGAEAVVERRPDGGVEVEIQVTDRDSFRSFALIFLEHAEVLGPPELREEVVTWLTTLAEP